ncbi:tetratricopeptide repeat protein [Pelomyxa schiedti]|nr:tetratricopeptide repeat protein [Pelomyxa schiedti]
MMRFVFLNNPYVVLRGKRCDEYPRDSLLRKAQTCRRSSMDFFWAMLRATCEVCGDEGALLGFCHFLLGCLYLWPIGVKRDYSKAVEHYKIAVVNYREAIARGNPWAYHNLGSCYVSGCGVEKDSAEGIRCYEASAAKGNAFSMTKLATVYAAAPDSKSQALGLLERAAAQGLDEAQNQLGVQYETGEIVPVDRARAVSLYRLAASQGDILARYNLARCFHYKLGTPKDVREAVRWYKLSRCSQACEALSNLLPDVHWEVCEEEP